MCVVYHLGPFQVRSVSLSEPSVSTVLRLTLSGMEGILCFMPYPLHHVPGSQYQQPVSPPLSVRKVRHHLFGKHLHLMQHVVHTVG